MAKCKFSHPNFASPLMNLSPLSRILAHRIMDVASSSCSGLVQSRKCSFRRTETQCNAGSAALDGTGISPEEPDRASATVKQKKKKKKFTVAGVDQEELVDDPRLIADEDSLFVEFDGVLIHYKTANVNPSSSLDSSFHGDLVEDKIQQQPKPLVLFPAILLHGFGASAFSWNWVSKPLSIILGSPVLAFDRPGFGLTSRSKITDSTCNPYSLHFSASVTLKLVDLVRSHKAILIGHSAGCLVAVKAYFQNPEKIAALILVAPAIVAPKAPNPPKRNHAQTDKDKDPVEKTQKSNPLPVQVQHNNFSKIRSMVLMLWNGFCVAVARAAQRIKEIYRACYRTVLSALLRSRFAAFLVRVIFDKFGREAIRYAWYDANKVSQEIIEGYTKPLKCRGWETALLEFTLSVLTESSTPIQNMLQDISCPVLVVTGDTDRLVPARNAERLAKALPRSKFEMIKNCGHLPHEENPQEFINTIQNFLQWAFGTPQLNQVFA